MGYTDLMLPLLGGYDYHDFLDGTERYCSDIAAEEEVANNTVKHVAVLNLLMKQSIIYFLACRKQLIFITSPLSAVLSCNLALPAVPAPDTAQKAVPHE